MSKTKTFDEFLEKTHADNYEGEEEFISEDLERWLENMDLADLKNFADLYGELMYKKGKLDQLLESNKK